MIGIGANVWKACKGEEVQIILCTNMKSLSIVKEQYKIAGIVTIKSL